MKGQKKGKSQLKLLSRKERMEILLNYQKNGDVKDAILKVMPNIEDKLLSKIYLNTQSLICQKGLHLDAELFRFIRQEENELKRNSESL